MPTGFRPPPFNDLIIYQLHIGVFYATEGGHDIRKNRVAKFLDVLGHLEHLAALGVNAILCLPVVEWQGQHSRGYNNTDFFSAEMDYALRPEELTPYLLCPDQRPPASKGPGGAEPAGPAGPG